jgi:hypothetical protein
MDQVAFNSEQVEMLGSKLDRFANELSNDEKTLLAAVFELAAQRAPADADLPLSQRLNRVLGPDLKGRIDAFSVII